MAWIRLYRVYHLIEENRIVHNDFFFPHIDFKRDSFHENSTPKWGFNYSIVTFLFPPQNTPGKPDSIYYQKSLYRFGRIRTSVSDWNLVTLKESKMVTYLCVMKDKLESNFVGILSVP